MTPRHLTPADLANRWNLSQRTLERWRVLGWGPCFLKIGGRVAYRLEDVESYEREHLHASTSEPHLSLQAEGAR